MTISIRTTTSGRTYQQIQQTIAKRHAIDRSEAAAAGQIFGVQLPSTDEDDEPWTALPSRRNKEPPIEGPLPKSVEVVLGNQIYIDRSKLPPGSGEPHRTAGRFPEP